MNNPESATTPYESEVLVWRQTLEDNLRAENGWLTLVGLCWLHEGENTIGSDPGSDVQLPQGSLPAHLGLLTLIQGQVNFTVTAEGAVEIDSALRRESILRADTDDGGPTYVKIHSVTFYVVKRGDQWGIRIRDRENPSRLAFRGRQWFPINPAYCLTVPFQRYPAPRTLDVVNIVGITVPMQNSGYVEFSLHGHSVRLEAIGGDDPAEPLWFIFRDATSSALTYPAGRYLDAPLSEDGTVTLDFNKAYNPPCAFTAYATCPLPPREHVLSLAIEAGEKRPAH